MNGSEPLWLQAAGTAGVLALLTWLVSALISGKLAAGRLFEAEHAARIAAEKRAEELQAAMTAREREIGDQLAPLLREAVKMIPKAIEGVEAARQDQSRAVEVDRMLRRLELIVDTAAKRGDA